MIKLTSKKAATYSTWIEIMVIIALFLGVLLIIGANMNNIYGQSNDYSFGIASNGTLSSLQSQQSSLNTDINTGQSSLTSFGIFLVSTLPHMLLGVNSMIWNFITGGFIESVVKAMNLGEYANLIIIVFRTLYFLAIAFILLKIITKINI